jgi:hypothetical protein
MLGNIDTAVSVAIAFAIILVYIRRIDWHDRVALHLISLVGIILTVLALATIRVITHSDPDHGWFAWLRAVVYTGFPFVLGWQLYLILNLTRKNDDDQLDQSSGG